MKNSKFINITLVVVSDIFLYYQKINFNNIPNNG